MLQVQAVIAGVCFAIWPLLMNRSGLNSNVASFSYMFMVVAIIFMYNIFRWAPINMTSSQFAIVFVSGACGAVGTLFFNSMLATASPQKVGSLILLMLLAQAIIPVVYSLMFAKFSATQALGIILAVVAIILLSK